MGKPITLHYSFAAPHAFMSELIREEITMHQAEKIQRENAQSSAFSHRLQGYKVRTDSHIETCTRMIGDDVWSHTGRVYMVHVTFNSKGK